MPEARRATRTPAAPDPAPLPAQSAPTGLVEHFSRRQVLGWVSVPADAPPVRVQLLADDLVLASTYATVSASLSASDSPRRTGTGTGPSTDRPGEKRDRPDAWQGAMIKGPAGDRRNSEEQIRVFSFRVRGVWPFLAKRNRLSVKIDGHPLPIVGHGTFLQPRRRGERSLEELRQLFASGHLLDQRGHISLSRKLDTQWQQSMMRLHRRVHRLVQEQFGHQTFAVYGTLLGAVREQGPIGHDTDFDTAYLSQHTRGQDAAAELEAIAFALIADDLDVDCHPTALHISDPQTPEERIDLFHCYFDDEDQIAFPFGVAGTSPFTRQDWDGLVPAPFLDEEILVPAGAERLVAHLYGDDWRRPKPGFNWSVDRTAWAPEGHLSVEQQTRVHWAGFYRRHHFSTGSTFFRFALGIDDLPQHLVDIGCGDGRDARSFAAEGRTVLGLDASPEGVRHARDAAKEAGVEDRVAFEVCDVSDVDTLERHLAETTARADGPVGFYLRFFLHAIPERTQQDLLATIARISRPGDLLLAEFRTLGDQDQPKAHGNHYRRYIDAPALREDLGAFHGFEVEYFTESRGLSPYGEEDPMLCRLVARRTAPGPRAAAPDSS